MTKPDAQHLKRGHTQGGWNRYTWEMSVVPLGPQPGEANQRPVTEGFSLPYIGLERFRNAVAALRNS